MSICFQDFERKRNFGVIRYKCAKKLTCINLKLDLVNMHAYIKFGENQSIYSRDIERKRNFGVNQGP